MLHPVCKCLAEPKIREWFAQIKADLLPGFNGKTPRRSKQKIPRFWSKIEAAEAKDLWAGEDGKGDDRIAPKDQEIVAKVYLNKRLEL